MELEAEVLAWHAALPKDKKREWNHPSSVWRHFDKQVPGVKLEKAGKIGVTPTEEKEAVENAQVLAIQKRDDKIVQLRATIGDHHATIDALNAEVVKLRKVRTGTRPETHPGFGAAIRNVTPCGAPTADHPLDAYWTPKGATRALMAIER